MRGYFGIGVEGLSKPMNAGNLFRSAHAFGASFIFTVNAAYRRGEVGRADTSDTPGKVPLYEFATVDEMELPRGCRLVGVELVDDAIELPSFRHPRQAAYILGPERGSLSPEVLARCEFTVKIPTKFCINLAATGVVVMYDRLISMGRFAERAVMAGGAPIAPPAHVSGGPVIRRRHGAARRASPGGRRASRGGKPSNPEES